MSREVMLEGLAQLRQAVEQPMVEAYLTRFVRALPSVEERAGAYALLQEIRRAGDPTYQRALRELTTRRPR
ncbi:MAG TPA: hypothetical protein VNK50_13065 [Calidithermus sp.]|nr:hypothetical protein [Calidithermus sp.]